MCVTRTREPNGNDLWAAVIPLGLNQPPAATRWDCQ